MLYHQVNIQHCLHARSLNKRRYICTSWWNSTEPTKGVRVRDLLCICPFDMIFFYVLILSAIYLFEPGVASVTNAYKKIGWAGLGWTGQPLFHQKRLPAGFVRKTHFPKKTKKLLAFGFVWLDHHITHIQYLSSTVRSHPASTPTSTSKSLPKWRASHTSHVSTAALRNVEM